MSISPFVEPKNQKGQLLLGAFKLHVHSAAGEGQFDIIVQCHT